MTTQDEKIPKDEALRSLEDIVSPDIRSSFFSRSDEMGVRDNTLADHHADIAGIKLSSRVPADVIIQFETARNLYLYAWYVYRFYPVAQQQALASLELGLRHKIEKSIPKPPRTRQAVPTLRPLIRYAIDTGLIKNEGFRQWHDYVQRRAEDRHRDEQIAAMLQAGDSTCEILIADVVPNEQDRDYDYLAILKETLPAIRNSLAHGSTNLSHQVLGIFVLVQEILDQVYKET
ncbi:hypothetical protein [Pseudoduganella armeniaca]|uniref:hypothetical protein n=1 Tax=Pseudoduganella armeniaca TaxID=2072590 RepID=UPI0015E63C25|nr:hypothetical protein [Pseudoduganella armeniaca]